MSLGFEQAGFDVAAAVEYDPIHCATHEFNFPDCAAICRSVADIGAKYIRDHSRIGDRPVDVLFGGAPCQGFSMIGKRALDDPRNSLVHHFVRLVVELKASYFVFENVRGLTIGEHRKFLEEIVAEFRKNGYNVLEDYRVLNASHHGVPQNRQRLFLMGARKGFPLPEYPEATHEVNGDARSANLFCRSTPTVWDALRDIPEADDFEELLHRDWVRARFKKATEYSAPVARGSSRPRGLFDAARIRCKPSHLQPAHHPYRPVEEAFSRNAARRHRARQPLPQTRSHGRLQYDSRRDRQRSRSVYVAPSDTSLLASLHHRAGSCAPAFLSRLGPLSRDEMARLPPDRQFGAAAACAGGCVEGPRSVLRS